MFSKSISEQKALLQERRIRKTIAKIQKDSDSLRGLRDGDSFRTRWTDTGSKLSVTFSFDHQLLLTQVYERVIRQSVKNSIRRARQIVFTHPNGLVEPPPIVDIFCHKVLILGTSESGKSTLIKQIKTLHMGGYTEEERELYRPTIYKNLVDCARALIQAMSEFGIRFDNAENEAKAGSILGYEYECDYENKWFPPFDADIASTITSIWRDMCILDVFEHETEFYLMDGAR